MAALARYPSLAGPRRADHRRRHRHRRDAGRAVRRPRARGSASSTSTRRRRRRWSPGWPAARHAPPSSHADLTDIAALDARDRRAARSASARSPCCSTTPPTTSATRSTTPRSESWDAGIAVNLKHQFFAAKNVAADMKAAGGGSIVNFGSVSWMLKQGGMPVYTTVEGRGAGPDAQPGARLRAVQHPRQHAGAGLGDDREAGPPVARRDGPRRHRARPVHQPAAAAEHIARMALFLAADDSAMCTAQDFIVDGGWV